ncbi:hypothetical protein [Streptomyces sp. NPDC005760]|uniref:hypothetical protein n=1 Tax=Streptomyces sp. NPDC005760 TaxID=3156718 RepID=UPI0033CEF4CA
MEHKATLRPGRTPAAPPPPPPQPKPNLERAWLHHCGRLVKGTDEDWCPGCRSDVKRPTEVEARYVLVPVHGPQAGT